MGDFLSEMAEASRARAATARRRYRDDELDLPLPALKLGDFDVIAELKRRSPSAGALADDGLDLVAQARRYADGGAAAVSVLTEPSRFGGALEHLRELAAVLAGVGIPAMRKDFLVERAQLLEARAAGAGGTLLIAAMLDHETLRDMLDCALEHGLFVLVEAFDGDDLARLRAVLEAPRSQAAATAGALLVGVNTRNLRTLEVDAARLAALAAELPGGARAVAESGLATAADAAEAAGLGYSLALVGTALMQADDPAGLLRAMRAAGRERRAA